MIALSPLSSPPRAKSDEEKSKKRNPHKWNTYTAAGERDYSTLFRRKGGREGPRHIIIALIYERSEKEKRERECELPPLTQISRDGGEARNSASRLKGNGELVARNFSRSVL